MLVMGVVLIVGDLVVPLHSRVLTVASRASEIESAAATRGIGSLRP